MKWKELPRQIILQTLALPQHSSPQSRGKCKGKHFRNCHLFRQHFELKVPCKDFIFQETAIERATAVFEKLDVNDDGELNEDEFVGGCLKDETLANLLNTGASEEKKSNPEEESNENKS